MAVPIMLEDHPSLAVNNHGSEGEICDSSPECLSSKISRKFFIQIGYWILKPQNFNYIPCILKTKIGIILKTNSMFARENHVEG